MEFIGDNLLLILFATALAGYTFAFVGDQIEGRDIFDILGEFFGGISRIITKFFGRKNNG